MKDVFGVVANKLILHGRVRECHIDTWGAFERANESWSTLKNGSVMRWVGLTFLKEAMVLGKA